MKVTDLLEAPLANIEYHTGELRGEHGSFNAKERAMIKRYMANNVYKERLKGLPIDLYVYLIDDYGSLNIGRMYPEGEITPAAIEKGMYTLGGPSRDSDKGISIDVGIIKTVLDKVLENQKKHADGVHFIMADNFSGVDDINVTPWILVHRFLHAGFKADKTFYESVKEFVKMIRPFGFHEILKMKSAAKPDTSPSEMMVEIVTELMINGKLRINMPKNTLVQDAYDVMMEDFKDFPSKLKGKIFYI